MESSLNSNAWADRSVAVVLKTASRVTSVNVAITLTDSRDVHPGPRLDFETANLKINVAIEAHSKSSSLQATRNGTRAAPVPSTYFCQPGVASRSAEGTELQLGGGVFKAAAFSTCKVEGRLAIRRERHVSPAAVSRHGEGTDSKMSTVRPLALRRACRGSIVIGGRSAPKL